MPDRGVTTKAMKVGTYIKLDAALYIWFRQQREKKVKVNGSCSKKMPSCCLINFILTRLNLLMSTQVFNGSLVSNIVLKTCPFKVNKCQL